MYKDHVTDKRTIRHHGGTVTQYMFENGYGISIAEHDYAYGGREIAVLHGGETTDDPATTLCYQTEITDDVIGWLSPCDVEKYANQISELEPNPLCAHTHKR